MEETKECVEKVLYREKITEMVNEIEDRKILEFIYYYTKSGYKEELAGK